LRLLGTGELERRLWTLPAINVLGIQAPGLDEASHAIVPHATARVSVRLAPSQDPNAALGAIQEHLRAADDRGHRPRGQATPAHLRQHVGARPRRDRSRTAAAAPLAASDAAGPRGPAPAPRRRAGAPPPSRPGCPTGTRPGAQVHVPVEVQQTDIGMVAQQSGHYPQGDRAVTTKEQRPAARSHGLGHPAGDPRGHGDDPVEVCCCRSGPRDRYSISGRSPSSTRSSPMPSSRSTRPARLHRRLLLADPMGASAGRHTDEREPRHPASSAARIARVPHPSLVPYAALGAPPVPNAACAVPCARWCPRRPGAGRRTADLPSAAWWG